MTVGKFDYTYRLHNFTNASNQTTIRINIYLFLQFLLQVCSILIQHHSLDRHSKYRVTQLWTSSLVTVVYVRNFLPNVDHTCIDYIHGTSWWILRVNILEDGSPERKKKLTKLNNEMRSTTKNGSPKPFKKRSKNQTNS